MLRVFLTALLLAASAAKDEETKARRALRAPNAALALGHGLPPAARRRLRRRDARARL